MEWEDGAVALPCCHRPAWLVGSKMLGVWAWVGRHCVESEPSFFYFLVNNATHLARTPPPWHTPALGRHLPTPLPYRAALHSHIEWAPKYIDSCVCEICPRELLPKEKNLNRVAFTYDGWTFFLGWGGERCILRVCSFFGGCRWRWTLGDGLWEGWVVRCQPCTRRRLLEPFPSPFPTPIRSCPYPCPCRDDETPNERNATQRIASHLSEASEGIGWHTAFGRLLSRTLLFYILGSTHRTEQKKSPRWLAKRVINGER